MRRPGKGLKSSNTMRHQTEDDQLQSPQRVHEVLKMGTNQDSYLSELHMKGNRAIPHRHRERLAS